MQQALCQALERTAGIARMQLSVGSQRLPKPVAAPPLWFCNIASTSDITAELVAEVPGALRRGC